jgi:hypothetical protein
VSSVLKSLRSSPSSLVSLRHYQASGCGCKPSVSRSSLVYTLVAFPPSQLSASICVSACRGAVIPPPSSYLRSAARAFAIRNSIPSSASFSIIDRPLLPHASSASSSLKYKILRFQCQCISCTTFRRFFIVPRQDPRLPSKLEGLFRLC